MAKWNQKKDTESNQRNIRVTAGDNYRVEELDAPLLEPFPEYVYWMVASFKEEK